MKKSRFTDSQILAFLKEAGVKVLGLCRKHGMSDAIQCRNSLILGLTDPFKRAEKRCNTASSVRLDLSALGCGFVVSPNNRR